MTLPTSAFPPSDPLIIQVIRAQQANIIAGDVATLNRMADRWIQIERTLAAQVAQLAYELTDKAKSGEAVTRAEILRLQRYKELAAAATRETDKYVDYATRTVTDRQRTLIAQGLSDAVESTRYAYQSFGLDYPAFNLLPKDALNAIIGMAGDGSPLNTLLSEIGDLALVGMTDALVDGIALGLPPMATAKRMADGFAVGLERAFTIARTETLRAYRFASQEQYKAGGVVIEYMRIAQHTPTTCAGCLFAEGEVFPVERDFDAHPNCRCSTIPVVDGAPRPQFETGEDWFLRQPEDIQRKILGPGKYDAWQRGVPLKNMSRHVDNDIWGGAFVPARLGDLEIPGGSITENIEGKIAPKAQYVFTPAENKVDAFVRMSNYSKTVDFGRELNLDQLNSLLRAMEESNQVHGVTYSGVGYQKKPRKSYGLHWFNLKDKTSRIEIQKTFIRNAKAKADECRETFLRVKSRNIDKLMGYISDPRMEKLVTYNSQKLSNYQKVTRWATFDEAKDPIYAVFKHETYHALYNQKGLESKFLEALKNNGVSDRNEWFAVSEYGASKMTELFPEIGTAIDCGLDIPQPFVDAFMETVK